MVEIEDKNYSELDKEKSFTEFCELIVKTTDEDGNTTEEEKEGIQIKGKDVIFLNAAKIYPPQDPDLLPDGQYTPLLTEAQDIVGAINELFQCGSGGGDIFLVNGSESGITVTMVKNRGEAQELTANFFTFETKTYKTITPVGSGKTTREKTWSKNVITAILKNDETVCKFTLDSGGNATAVLDSVGNDVLNGITGEESKSVLTTTPEGIALGWALAYNKEQSSALQKAIDAYKDGIDDCDKINESEGVSCNCGCDCGDGDGTGGDGTGGNGTGDGSGGIKLPDKNFEAVELPDGTGCMITVEKEEYGRKYRIVIYCDYAVKNKDGSITRYNTHEYTYRNGSVTYNYYNRQVGYLQGTSTKSFKATGDYRV